MKKELKKKDKREINNFLKKNWDIIIVEFIYKWKISKIWN